VRRVAVGRVGPGARRLMRAHGRGPSEAEIMCGVYHTRGSGWSPAGILLYGSDTGRRRCRTGTQAACVEPACTRAGLRGAPARRSGRISPVSSNSTIPLQSRTQPCSWWLATTCAASRSDASAEGHVGWCGHISWLPLADGVDGLDLCRSSHTVWSETATFPARFPGLWVTTW